MVRTIGLRRIFIELDQPLVAQKVSNDVIWTTDFEILALSTNGGDVAIGDSTVEIGSWIPLSAGDKKNYTHGTGNMGGSDPVLAFDLSKLYVVGRDAGDEIIIQYLVTE